MKRIGLSGALAALITSTLFAQNWPANLDTARSADYMSVSEKDVVFELNKVRSNPRAFADQYIKPEIAKPSLGNTSKDAQECYDKLARMQAMPILEPQKGVFMTADDLARRQEGSGETGHDRSRGITESLAGYGQARPGGEWAENCAYGGSSANGVVVMLLIDSGVPGRGHFKNITNARFTKTGVAQRTHKKYRNVTVMDFVVDYITNTETVRRAVTPNAPVFAAAPVPAPAPAPSTPPVLTPPDSVPRPGPVKINPPNIGKPQNLLQVKAADMYALMGGDRTFGFRIRSAVLSNDGDEMYFDLSGRPAQPKTDTETLQIRDLKVSALEGSDSSDWDRTYTFVRTADPAWYYIIAQDRAGRKNVTYGCVTFSGDVNNTKPGSPVVLYRVLPWLDAGKQSFKLALQPNGAYKIYTQRGLVLGIRSNGNGARVETMYDTDHPCAQWLLVPLGKW